MRRTVRQLLKRPFFSGFLLVEADKVRGEGVGRQMRRGMGMLPGPADY